jgi:hypothetical protein
MAIENIIPAETGILSLRGMTITIYYVVYTILTIVAIAATHYFIITIDRRDACPADSIYRTPPRWKEDNLKWQLRNL